MVSIRRQSLAKLSALPIEAPITKVIALISAAQESSPASVVQTLDKVRHTYQPTPYNRILSATDTQFKVSTGTKFPSGSFKR